jgi:hypothetical protein
MYHAGGRVPQSPMEGLTPASADDLPPLGELLVDDPFWQYPARGLARKGPGTCVSGPLRLLLRVTWLLSRRLAASPPSLNLPGGSGPAWLADTGPPSCCSNTTPRPGPARARRPWTWSASALTGARTGPAYGRPRSRTRVTPGWNCGWPLTGTRSSAGPRAGSIGVTTITADCSWRPLDLVRPGGSGGGERAAPRDGASALSRSASVTAGGPPAARHPIEPAPPPAAPRVSPSPPR